LPAAVFAVMVSIVSVGMLITGPFPAGLTTGDQSQLHTFRDSPALRILVALRVLVCMGCAV
ncbi:hypothetical protein KIH79_00005, partial [Bifidobacterium sp. 82T10]